MHSFLALGDSYTIGEGLPLSDSYPYQTVQLLRKGGLPYTAPEIIARTGWTTGELAAAIDRTTFLPHYDIVTLLIGVNNQYRGLDLEEYGKEFEQLFRQARTLATPSTGRVFVLSIPDWGVTPFAEAQGKDKELIATEINSFNTIARQIVEEQGLPFIDITGHSRTRGAVPGKFA
ncbi:MAG: SGNH/GDSL hydrolase family protein, partial [Bacteroidetes bacterium]|nr:SGNH/GDSL hydrolase family protein [Bacteroidota bacterium]